MTELGALPVLRSEDMLWGDGGAWAVAYWGLEKAEG